MQFLQRQVLEGEGSCLHDAADVVLLHIERENLDELEHFHVEVVVVDFEVAGTHVDSTTFGVGVEREELLQNEEPVLEVRVAHLQSQLEEHVIVLIVRDAEAVPFEHLTIRHASVAQENLRAFGESILTRRQHESVVFRHVIDDFVPDLLSHIFAHTDFFFTLVGFSHFGKLARFHAHALIL